MDFKKQGNCTGVFFAENLSATLGGNVDETYNGGAVWRYAGSDRV